MHREETNVFWVQIKAWTGNPTIALLADGIARSVRQTESEGGTVNALLRG